MKRVVYKYALSIKTDMPKGAKVLSVQMLNGILTAWALVDPAEKEIEQRQFRSVSTGVEIDFEEFMSWNYITSVQTSHGLVWHIFEK